MKPDDLKWSGIRSLRDPLLGKSPEVNEEYKRDTSAVWAGCPGSPYSSGKWEQQPPDSPPGPRSDPRSCQRFPSASPELGDHSVRELSCFCRESTDLITFLGKKQ